MNRYKKIKILSYIPGGSWDDGEPLGTIVFACVWEGAETYNKGKHYLHPEDYFYGSTPDITPECSRFAHKDRFEEMYVKET